MGSQVPSGFTGIRLSSPKSLCQRRRCLACLGLGWWWGGGRFTKFWKSTSSLTCTASWRYATRSSLGLDSNLQSNLTLRYKIFSNKRPWPPRQKKAISTNPFGTGRTVGSGAEKCCQGLVAVPQVIEHLKEVVWPAAQTAEKGEVSWHDHIVHAYRELLKTKLFKRPASRAR